LPRTYDPEFRRHVIELVKAGRPVRAVAAELGLAEATVYRWKAQDLVDRGAKPGVSTSEQGELGGGQAPNSGAGDRAGVGETGRGAV
jgi:transposase